MARSEAVNSQPTAILSGINLVDSTGGDFGNTCNHVTRCKVEGFQWSIFCIFEIIIFCFVVAICYLVHDVEAMYGLP